MPMETEKINSKFGEELTAGRNYKQIMSKL